MTTNTLRIVAFPFVVVGFCLIHSANTVAVPVGGDPDADGDIDNSDLAIIAGNDGLFPATLSDGDTTSDGVVDEADFVFASAQFEAFGFGGFFAMITSDANPAQLVYKPATGEVLLDQTNAPGGVISTFVLGSNGAFNAPGSALFPFGGTLLEDAPSVISQSDPNSYAPAPGFATNPHNLGPILPAGLDLPSLTTELSTAVYVGLTGTGVRAFELVVVPEPMSVAPFLVSLLSVARRRR